MVAAVFVTDTMLHPLVVTRCDRRAFTIVDFVWLVPALADFHDENRKVLPSTLEKTNVEMAGGGSAAVSFGVARLCSWL